MKKLYLFVIVLLTSCGSENIYIPDIDGEWSSACSHILGGVESESDPHYEIIKIYAESGEIAFRINRYFDPSCESESTDSSEIEGVYYIGSTYLNEADYPIRDIDIILTGVPNIEDDIMVIRTVYYISSGILRIGALKLNNNRDERYTRMDEAIEFFKL